ncbi:MAG: hypothetical protein K2N90_04570 [Lachnospiraceae bacterium]|nr:hypothetical protein [Lachnospiraceae bacterium]
MLDQIETIFDGMSDMIMKLGKTSYRKNIELFREQNEHFFQEMIQYVEKKENKEEAAKEMAQILASAVEKRFSAKGRIKPYKQADVNLFMIYYVFPTILLMESEYSDLIAGSIRDLWKSRFRDSNIEYTTYDELYNSFQERILGISWK